MLALLASDEFSFSEEEQQTDSDADLRRSKRGKGKKEEGEYYHMATGKTRQHNTKTGSKSNKRTEDQASQDPNSSKDSVETITGETEEKQLDSSRESADTVKGGKTDDNEDKENQNGNVKNDKKKTKEETESETLKKEINQMKDQLSKTKKEIGQLKTKNSQLEKEIKDKNKQIKAQKTTIRNHAGETLKNRIKELEKKVKEKEEIVEKQKKALEAYTYGWTEDEVNKERNRWTNKELEYENKIEGLKSNRDALMNSLTRAEGELKELKEKVVTKRNILLLGDSNAGIMKPYLNTELSDKAKVDHLMKPTTVHALRWSENLEETPKETAIIIHIGSNDLKRGDTADEITDRIQQVTDKLDKEERQYMVCQLPPIYWEEDSEIARRQAAVNATIKERYKTKAIITTELDGDRSNIADDGLHLTDLASKNAAKIIAGSVNSSDLLEKKPEQPQEERQKQKTDSFTTNQTIAAIIIGNQGYRVNKMKTKHNVKIETEYKGQERVFVIHGKAEDVAAAKNEMDQISKETNIIRDPPTRPPKRNIVCRYYKRGQCKWDKNCIYLHSKDPVDISPRTPPREYNHPPTDRRRVILKERLGTTSGYQAWDQLSSPEHEAPESSYAREWPNIPSTQYQLHKKPSHSTSSRRRTPETTYRNPSPPRRNHRDPRDQRDRREPSRERRNPKKEESHKREPNKDRPRTSTPDKRHYRGSERNRTPPRRTPEKRHYRGRERSRSPPRKSPRTRKY